MGLLLDPRLLEEQRVAPHVAHAEVHGDDEPVLLDVGARVECERQDLVIHDLALEDRVRLVRLDDPEAPVGRERLDDRLGENVLHRRLGRPVREHRDGDAPDVTREVATERVAAAGEGYGHECQGPQRHARVTMLTSRFGTTTIFSTRREATHGLPRSSFNASWRRRSSAAPPPTRSRPRPLPSTGTPTVTSVFLSASGSAVGQRCAKTLSRWPSRDQSSSAMWGQNGPSSRVIVSTASRSNAARSAGSTVPAEGASNPCRAFTSSMIAATAVLKWDSRSMSSGTRWIVSWVSRPKVRAAFDNGTTPPRVGVRSSSRCVSVKRHTRLRKRKAPSIPWSFHSRSFSGGAAKSSKSRPVSAPYFSRM